MNKNKVPVSAMMDMARVEIANLVFAIMTNNHIPAGLMCYILDSVQSDVKALYINDISSTLMQNNNEEEKKEC